MNDATLKTKIVFEADEQSAKKAMGALDKGAKGANSATKATNENLNEMVDNLQSIRSMDALAFLKKSLNTTAEQIDKVKDSVKGLGNYLRNSFSLIKMLTKSKGFSQELREKYNVSPPLEKLKLSLHLIGRSFQEIGKTGVVAFKALNTALTTTMAQLTALVGVVIALSAVIKNAVNRAKELKTEMSQAGKLGLDLRAYQEWQYVMETLGGSAEDLADSIKTLSSEQAILAEGLEGNRKAFEELGLSVAEVTSLTQEELFGETVKRLQNVEDGVRRTQLAYQIFGEDTAARLTNILHLNNEELESLQKNFYILGGQTTSNLVELSKDLTYQLQNLKTAWNGLRNTLAEGILPYVIQFVNWLIRAIVIVNMFARTVFNLENSFGKAGKTAITDGLNKGLNSALDTANEIKRTLMGFDELNVVSNPNASTSSTIGGGLTGAEGENLLGNLDLDFSDIESYIEEHRAKLQSLIPTLMIVGGLAGMVISLLCGNWISALFFAGIAGVGIMAGNSNGLFENWKLQINEIMGLALMAVGLLVAVIGGCMGNIPAILGGLALFGTGMAMGGANGLASLINQYRSQINLIIDITIIAFTLIAGVFFLLTGNIPMAILCGVGLVAGLVGLGVDTGFFEKCKEKLKQFGEFFKELFVKIGNVISDAWQNIKDFFGKIGEKISEVIGKVKDFFGLGNKASNTSFSFSGTSPRVALATGGITTGPTRALIGEAGREAVLPLENNTGWMDALADRIASRNSSPSKIVLKVGEKELGWATINGINSITKQTGEVQLIV